MERKIISKENLSDLFARDELAAAIMLRDALTAVKEKTGNITDPDIKSYNTEENEFMFDISLTTIKSYASKNGYGIFNVSGDDCVVKQFSVESYKEIKKKLDNIDGNMGDTVMETNKNNLTAEQKLALDFVAKSKEYKEQTNISIRCASCVQARLDDVYKKYSMFPKQYVISYLLDMALTELEKNNEKID